LEDIINKITIEDYNQKIDFVKKNFELAKNYTIADNIIFEKLKKEKLF
jgi:ABC-type polar amino acid transport system ATPase subunit